MATKGQALYINTTNEAIVLATMAKDTHARRQMAQLLHEDDFGDDRHRVIFSGLCRMEQGGLTWSEDTLADLVGGPREFGGYRYLRDILADYDPNANLVHHATRMKVDAAAWAVASRIPDLAELCADPKRDPQAITRWLRTQADRVERLGLNFERTGSALRKRWADEMRLRAKVGPIQERAYSPVFDRLVNRGFRKGLSLLVGRPGHAKTTWLSYVVMNRARHGKRSFIGGWEMEDIDYLEMMAAAELEIPHDRFELNAREFAPDMNPACDEIIELISENVTIEENPFPHLAPVDKPWQKIDRNLRHLESTIRRASENHRFFALDVVNKSLPDRKPEIYAEALVRIREVAIASSVHVMLLHHLNREGANGPPTLETIKNSGSFEEEADLVLGADRPVLRLGQLGNKTSDTLDIHVLKQRKGQSQTCVRYDFDGRRFRLSNEREHKGALGLERGDGDDDRGDRFDDDEPAVSDRWRPAGEPL